ncbi:MAG: class I SAM-dependent methyltransferase [Bacteroidetes bacterium]|nr:class I SAM-dependent methyltransferase [Bacteroidota bacterium]
MKNDWNARFGVEEFVYGKEPNAFFKEEIDRLKPGRILLPAEGEGRNAVYAAKKGWEVVCFDWSDEGKKKADKLAEMEGVKINYFVSEISSFDYPSGEFDAVGLVFVHLPEEEREELHKSVIKTLKPGGKLIFTAYDKTQLGKSSGGPKQIELLYSLAQIVEDFIDLEFDIFAKETVELSEGRLHAGSADVIKFSGIKK